MPLQSLRRIRYEIVVAISLTITIDLTILLTFSHSCPWWCTFIIRIVNPVDPITVCPSTAVALICACQPLRSMTARPRYPALVRTTLVC